MFYLYSAMTWTFWFRNVATKMLPWSSSRSYWRVSRQHRWRSSPTNCAAIRRQKGKWCPTLSILPNNTKTTAVNCLISLVDNKNDKCGGLNLKGRLNGFYGARALSITCLDLAVITWKQVITEYSANEHLMNGLGLVASRIWHKLRKICSHQLTSISWQYRQHVTTMSS